MDISTMMMGSMPQAPVTGELSAKVPAGPGSTGHAGEGSGNDFLFAKLLGTTLQVKAPDILPVNGSMVPELANLGAPAVTWTSTDPAIADQLLLALGKGAVSGQAEGNADGAASQLLAELQKLMAQNGSLAPSLRDQLRGALSPAVKNDGLIAVPVSDDAEEASGEQKASEMMMTLIATLNSALKQDLQQVVQDKPGEGVSMTKGADGVSREQKASEVMQALMATLNRAMKQDSQHVELMEVTEKPVDELSLDNKAPLSAQVVKPEQQVMPEAGNVQPNGDGETYEDELFKAIRAELKPVRIETAERATSSQGPAELMVGASASQSGQSKAATFHALAVAAAVTGKPVKFQEEGAAQEIDTKPVKPEMPVIDAMDVVFLEETPILEQSQGISLKQEPAVGVRQDIFRTETIQSLPREGEMRQGTAELPVMETVTREQIVNQVREKIEEHRITADKGQVTIRLNPAELGELKINVRMDEQRLRVEIVAENRTVKDALMENVGSLKEALARQNMDMKQFDVSTGSRQFFNQGFREGRQQEQQFVAQRQAAWLMGHAGDAQTSDPISWQPKKNALLDMMM